MTALYLVDNEAQQAKAPAVRVFEHWVFMLGKNPKRCALGPKRRKVIEAALALYDEETLRLAIDGCAASEWHAGSNDRGTAYDDIELILRDEAHIERFAQAGERLRERSLRKVLTVPVHDAVDQAARQEHLQQLRALAASLSGRAR